MDNHFIAVRFDVIFRVDRLAYRSDDAFRFVSPLPTRAGSVTEYAQMSSTSRPPPREDPSLDLQLRAVAAAEQARQLEDGGHAATARALWHEAAGLAERAAAEAADDVRRLEILHAAAAFAEKASS